MAELRQSGGPSPLLLTPVARLRAVSQHVRQEMALHLRPIFLGPPLPGPPASARPSAQFQSPDAFQREMARTSQSKDGAPKWEQMLKQLATSTGSTTTPTSSASSSQAPPPRYPPLGPRSSLTYELPKTAPPPQSDAPPLPQPRESQRPTPSPITDDEKSAPTGATAVSSQETPIVPASSSQATSHPVHGGETWRYS